MLTLLDVGFRLPDNRVLFENLSLQVEGGEAIAIEGPSGMGKSTLLGLIGGLLTPTWGTVEVGDTSGRTPYAWVLQTLNSLNSRTVFENACLFGHLDNQPNHLTRQLATAALLELGMADLMPIRARRLSGGEQQRLAVARALACSRPIILADEPSNQLDRQNAKRVMKALVGTAADGRAVVIVTHDHDALPAGCRVLHLSETGLHDA